LGVNRSTDQQSGQAVLVLTMMLSMLAVILSQQMQMQLALAFNLSKRIEGRARLSDIKNWLLSGLDCQATRAQMRLVDCANNAPVDLFRYSDDQPIMIEKAGKQMGRYIVQATCLRSTANPQTQVLKIFVKVGNSTPLQSLFANKEICP
jgi:hypothetical protein